MDAFLDAMYGTRENIGGTDLSELEKNAEAELLIDALKQEGFDTDSIEAMSGEDVVKVAAVLFGEDSALVKAAAKGTDGEGKPCSECGKEDCECPAAGKKEPPPFAKKEAAQVAVPDASGETFEEKVAHADKLGRVMAHSFVDEISNIEKRAQYEQVKEAKAQQASAALAQVNQTPAEKIAAKVEGVKPQVDQEKIAAAMALLKEAGVPLA